MQPRRARLDCDARSRGLEPPRRQRPQGDAPDMKIGIPKERRDEERRAAASPDTVKRYKGMGLEPVVEAGAGVGAAVADQAYQDAGAAIGDEAGAWASEIVLKVQRPTEAEMGHLRPGPGPDRDARPLQRQGSGRGLRQGRGQRLRHGAAAAHHARPGHGRALQPGQPRRLQGTGRRHGRVQSCPADDDDRGRHGDPGQGVHRRRRRGGAAGDRHGQAHGGGGDRDRRAPGGAARRPRAWAPSSWASCRPMPRPRAAMPGR